MRHPVVLACLFVVIVAFSASGMAAFPHFSNSGCQDPGGTRAADVSLHLVPFGLACDYEADATGPTERVVLAESVPMFALWVLLTAAAVGVGFRWRQSAAARGMVSGAVVLGLFGISATLSEFAGGAFAAVVGGFVAVAVLDYWLWPSHFNGVATRAVFLPSVTLVAAFLGAFSGIFIDGSAGYLAAAVAGLAAAAGISALAERVQSFAPPRPFEPLT